MGGEEEAEGRRLGEFIGCVSVSGLWDITLVACGCVRGLASAGEGDRGGGLWGEVVAGPLVLGLAGVLKKLVSCREHSFSVTSIFPSPWSASQSSTLQSPQSRAAGRSTLVRDGRDPIEEVGELIVVLSPVEVVNKCND